MNILTTRGSNGLVYCSDSAAVVGDAEPNSRGANCDEISEWLRRGEAGESASEAWATGFNEIGQKPSIFERDGIIANDGRTFVQS